MCISDRAKEDLPELIAPLEPLARDPVDATARLHLYCLLYTSRCV